MTEEIANFNQAEAEPRAVGYELNTGIVGDSAETRPFLIPWAEIGLPSHGRGVAIGRHDAQNASPLESPSDGSDSSDSLQFRSRSPHPQGQWPGAFQPG